MDEAAAPESRIGIVGNGWRAQFFHRIAAARPELFQIVGVVVHSPGAAERVARDWGVTTYLSLAELAAAQHPDFVIVSTPREVTVEMSATCVELGIPVLCETPPAPDVDGLRALWSRVGNSGMVQVAEQYLRMPANSVRKTLVGTGLIGVPTSVQVSSTHLYHAVSIIRGLLDAGFSETTVSGRSFTAPLSDPVDQNGWTGHDEPEPRATTIATIDFGGAMGLYDFTDNQWHNQLRSRRLVIRGSRGEISNDDVVRLVEPHTFLTSPIVRRQLGYDLDLDGYDTDHLSFEGTVTWRNPFLGSRFSDEEIAIATVMDDMARWTRDEGPAPYSLAEASQDHLIGLAIERSVLVGEPVRTAVEVWGRV